MQLRIEGKLTGKELADAQRGRQLASEQESEGGERIPANARAYPAKILSSPRATPVPS
ncbi:hypothetical protein [Hymenobacter wooponensis]|uniref:hypothetical protein n=1 Tax=Hymenobacter wooponensis TaxID=1525360 RepID=UPI001436981E|nr:hypothetical protein [Hymenobacter wooponensis]